MSVTINGTSGVTFNDASNQTTAATGFGFKNRIINGAMVIDQRNAGASVTPTTSAYVVDRWLYATTQSSKFTLQQNAGSVTPPVGFTNYLGATSTSAYSIVSSDVFAWYQRIEGFNCADLSWGTASAATVNLSFWVRSSLTGTFGGSFRNSSNNRSYPFSYTISASNTWEQKTITIAGDTTGTWSTNTETGIQVCFGLGVGSTFSGTAGSWSASSLLSSTGATSVVGTNGATFYITGVQLEKGSTATSFDYRPYSTELQLAQRYYYRRNYPITNEIVAVFQAYGAGAGFGKILDFPVAMRTAPTAAVSSTSHFGPTNTTGSNQAVFTATTIDLVNVLGLGTGSWAGSSGLAAGNATVINARSTSAYIETSAEL